MPPSVSLINEGTGICLGGSQWKGSQPQTASTLPQHCLHQPWLVSTRDLLRLFRDFQRKVSGYTGCPSLMVCMYGFTWLHPLLSAEADMRGKGATGTSPVPLRPEQHRPVGDSSSARETSPAVKLVFPCCMGFCEWHSADWSIARGRCDGWPMVGGPPGERVVW